MTARESSDRPDSDKRETGVEMKSTPMRLFGPHTAIETDEGLRSRTE